MRKPSITLVGVNIPNGNHCWWSTGIIRYVAVPFKINKIWSRKRLCRFFLNSESMYARWSVDDVDEKVAASSKQKRTNLMYDYFFLLHFIVLVHPERIKSGRPVMYALHVHCQHICIMIWVSLQWRLEFSVNTVEDALGYICYVSEYMYWMEKQFQKTIRIEVSSK